MKKTDKRLQDEKEKTSKKPLALVLCLLGVLLAVGVVVFFTSYHDYETTVVKPTCTANGYTQEKCKFCGKIERKNYTPATGHSYSAQKVVKKAGETTFGESQVVCSVCGDKETTSIEPTSKLRKLYINGDIYDTDNRSTFVDSVYSYSNKKVSSPVRITFAGTSTRKNYKHNISLQFINDNGDEKKVSLLEGVKSTQYTLYGDMYDCYNARGETASELFRDVRALSTPLTSELGQSYGTSEGEPCLVFVNDTFFGVYRLQETIGSDTFGFDGSEKQAIVKTLLFDDDTMFKEETPVDGSGSWDVVYNGSSDDEWAYKSLNELINCVVKYDGEEFKQKISEHLDVNAMIDYMLTVYFSAAGANTVNNFELATYDGKIWTPTITNIGMSFGLNDKGELGILNTTLVPKNDNGKIDDDTSSELWQKMLENYYDEIKTKYITLKYNQFTSTNINEIMNGYISQVPDSIYKVQHKLYEDVDSSFDLENQLDEFIKHRIEILDNFFEIN